MAAALGVSTSQFSSAHPKSTSNDTCWCNLISVIAIQKWTQWWRWALYFVLESYLSWTQCPSSLKRRLNLSWHICASYDEVKNDAFFTQSPLYTHCAMLLYLGITSSLLMWPWCPRPLSWLSGDMQQQSQLNCHLMSPEQTALALLTQAPMKLVSKEYTLQRLSHLWSQPTSCWSPIKSVQLLRLRK